MFFFIYIYIYIYIYLKNVVLPERVVSPARELLFQKIICISRFLYISWAFQKRSKLDIQQEWAGGRQQQDLFKKQKMRYAGYFANTILSQAPLLASRAAIGMVGWRSDSGRVEVGGLINHLGPIA